MATLKQIEANRLNAQNSTGPCSAAGKAASSRNALKSGIYAESEVLPGEDPAELETLRAEYYEAHQPRTPRARSLVDSLIHAELLARRLRRLEPKVFLAHTQALTHPDPDSASGQAYLAGSKDLDRLQRRINSNYRNAHRDYADLTLIESKYPAESAETLEPGHLSTAEPTQTKPETPQMASFRQTAPEPPTSSQASVPQQPQSQTPFSTSIIAAALNRQLTRLSEDAAVAENAAAPTATTTITLAEAAARHNPRAGSEASAQSAAPELSILSEDILPLEIMSATPAEAAARHNSRAGSEASAQSAAPEFGILSEDILPLEIMSATPVEDAAPRNPQPASEPTAPPPRAVREYSGMIRIRPKRPWE
jgi:hypothetical protein